MIAKRREGKLTELVGVFDWLMFRLTEQMNVVFNKGISYVSDNITIQQSS